ncbi:MAG: hypothetical protein IJ781_03365 [Atopobiaceae bacterium]|nr:hypothetical protein [Atopobiaceae bacterium]
MATKRSFPWEKGNEFLLACGDVHEPYQFCVMVLERFHTLVEFDEGVFLMLDGNRNIEHKYFSNISKHWSSLYLEYFAHASSSDFDLDKDVSEQRGVAYVKVIDWGSYDWINDDFMNLYIRARGLCHSLTFVLFDLNGAPAAVFSLDRMEEKPYTDFDVRVARAMVAHLCNFYKNLLVRPADQARVWDDVRGAADLTPREKEVADLLCQGVKPVNIARELHISIGTANKHIAHIYRKFGVGSRQELLVRMLG